MSNEQTKTKYHIEEKFENVIGIHKYKVESVHEGTVDYILYAKFYEVLIANEIKNLANNGFTIEYIEPGKDVDGEAFTKIRFRAIPQ